MKLNNVFATLSLAAIGEATVLIIE